MDRIVCTFQNHCEVKEWMRKEEREFEREVKGFSLQALVKENKSYHVVHYV